ncbi:hypothetical protein GGE67_003447 [Rhizobium leucaenae]|nr:hypothetical protein [Rhizobium leucaenae]
MRLWKVDDIVANQETLARWGVVVAAPLIRPLLKSPCPINADMSARF